MILALIGFTHVNQSKDWDASARRMIDIFMAGLRAHHRRDPPVGGVT